MTAKPGHFCACEPEHNRWVHGHVLIPWTGPAPDQAPQIEHLYLRPEPDRIVEPLPSWIRELPNCRSLRLPILYLAELAPEQVPAELVELAFDCETRWIGPNAEHVPPWPVHTRLPSLRTLRFEPAPAIGLPRGLTHEHLPRLETLTLALDPKGEALDRLANFEHLRRLEFGWVGNHDLFEPMTSSIEVLHVRGGGRHFPLDGIARWPSLVELELANMPGPIDCEWLAPLPKLAALTIHYCKHTENVEALLDCRALRRLTIRASGRIDAHLRHRLQEHGFERLDLGR